MGTWEKDKYLKRDGRLYDSRTGPSDPELIRQAQVGYYACITHLDHQIGRLILALKEYEVFDNSIILFTSDHGEELCDHHMWRKARPYEGSCHIPMIITAGKNVLPGIVPSSVCRDIVELRSWLHGEHAFSEFSNHWIVTKCDKYIWYSSSGEEQYFNLEGDPHELNNLINNPSYQERISELREHLIDSLSGRPEGYTDGKKLIPGRTAVDVLYGFCGE